LEESQIQVKPDKKMFARPHFNRKKLGMVLHMPIISVMVEILKQEDHDPGLLGQKVRPYLQNNHSTKG
jgi:hypothetical protein